MEEVVINKPVPAKWKEYLPSVLLILVFNVTADFLKTSGWTKWQSYAIAMLPAMGIFSLFQPVPWVSRLKVMVLCWLVTLPIIATFYVGLSYLPNSLSESRTLGFCIFFAGLSAVHMLLALLNVRQQRETFSFRGLIFALVAFLFGLYWWLIFTPSS